MVRPKDKVSNLKSGGSRAQGMSEAFANKSHQEQEKLQLKVATKLSEDIMSLFDEELHSDLIVTNGSCEVKGHHCIMRSRAKHLWRESWIFPTTAIDGSKMKGIRMTGLTEKQIRDFIRQLYCVTDSELLFEEFLPYFQSEQQTLISKDTTNIPSLDSATSSDKGKDLLEGERENHAKTDIAKESETGLPGADVLKDLESKESTGCEDEGNQECEKHGSDTYVDVLVRDAEDATSLKEHISEREEVNVLSDRSNLVESIDEIGLLEAVVQSEKDGCVCDNLSNANTKDELENTKDEIVHPREATNLLCGESCGAFDSTCNKDIPREGVIREVSDSQSSLHKDVKIVTTEFESLTMDELDFTSVDQITVCVAEDTHNSINDPTENTSAEKNDPIPVTAENISKGVCDGRCLITHDLTSASIESNLVATHDCVIDHSDGHIPSDAKDLNGNKSDVKIARNLERQACETDEEGKKIDKIIDGRGKSGLTVACETQSSDAKEIRFVNPYKTCSSLGNDLLCLYLQKLHCDCCLSVEGVQFLVHKSVLSARSPYFNAMFGGRWSESNLEVVQLEGVSALAMEHVLLFFYGGVIDTISSSDIVDLFIVADMYGVETLKLVLQFLLRKDMCHFFHKPCSTCIARAPEALTLCNNFRLEELEERLLKWISKYFTKIWCTKTFASLPEVLHQLCVEAFVNQMTEVNVLDIIIDCEKLTTSLPRIKWTESVLCMTTQLMDLAIEYTSANFIKVIHSPEFISWAKVAAWKASALEEIFNSVIDSLPVATAISVYQTLIDLKAVEDAAQLPDHNLVELLDAMIKRCEKFLRTHIHQVTRCKQWSTLNRSFQSQILENSSYFHLDHFPDPKPRPKKPVMFSTLAKHNRRSPSPSSLSTSSARTPSRREVTPSMGQRPSTRGKASGNAGKTVNVPEKSSKTAAGSRKPEAPSSMLSKSLKLYEKPSSKVTAKSFSDHPTGQSQKEAKPKAGTLTLKDKSVSHGKKLSQSFKQKPDYLKPSVSLSSSAPSGKTSPRLGRSLPSKIPQKAQWAQAQHCSHHQLRTLDRSSSKEADSVCPHNGESLPVSGAFSSTPPVDVNHHNHSRAVGLSEGCSLDLSTEKASDVPHLSQFHSPASDRCSLQEWSDTVPRNEHQIDNIAAFSSSDSNRTETSGHTHFGNNLENGSDTGQTSDDTAGNAHIYSEVTSNNEGEDQTATASQGFEQQEVNFLKASQPVRVSFVVPTDYNEEPP